MLLSKFLCDKIYGMLHVIVFSAKGKTMIYHAVIINAHVEINLSCNITQTLLFLGWITLRLVVSGGLRGVLANFLIQGILGFKVGEN